MVVFEIKYFNHKGRTNFTMTNRFYNFIWSLFFRIWNEYGNIFAAEFDVNRGSSIQNVSNFLRKTNISNPPDTHKSVCISGGNKYYFFGKLFVCTQWMIPTSNGFKACWLNNKMLLSPMFGFGNLNFAKGKFTGHELGFCQKKHSKTKFSDKSLLTRKITSNKFLSFGN